mmetsp:Transcript_9044/g.37296  ORF Transcript_9044/g.37296 Transcript_9044/m.37296 type:complete len:302 (+) Transcript_9044:789-1694(+)
MAGGHVENDEEAVGLPSSKAASEAAEQCAAAHVLQGHSSSGDARHCHGEPTLPIACEGEEPSQLHAAEARPRAPLQRPLQPLLQPLPTAVRQERIRRHRHACALPRRRYSEAVINEGDGVYVVARSACAAVGAVLPLCLLAGSGGAAECDGRRALSGGGCGEVFVLEGKFAPLHSECAGPERTTGGEKGEREGPREVPATERGTAAGDEENFPRLHLLCLHFEPHSHCLSLLRCLPLPLSPVLNRFLSVAVALVISLSDSVTLSLRDSVAVPISHSVAIPLRSFLFAAIPYSPSVLFTAIL